MLTFLRRLLGPPPPPPPRLVTLVNRVDEVEERLEYLHSELKSLRGRVTGALRRAPTAEDAPEEPIDEPTEVPPPTRRNHQSTAFLARRFRSF